MVGDEDVVADGEAVTATKGGGLLVIPLLMKTVLLSIQPRGWEPQVMIPPVLSVFFLASFWLML